VTLHTSRAGTDIATARADERDALACLDDPWTHGDVKAGVALALDARRRYVHALTWLITWALRERDEATSEHASTSTRTEVPRVA
jgi:hypothetical protein